MQRYEPGTRWRVISPQAKIQAAQHRMYAGGSMATSFHSVSVPVGTILTYAGTRNIGSDSVDEDVFETPDQERGAFSPSCWGGANVDALAPETRAAMVTATGSSYALEIGPVLDVLPDEIIAGFDTTADLMAYFASDISSADLQSLSGSRYPRPNWRVTVGLALSDLERYKAWRVTVARIRANEAHSAAVAIAEAGGRAEPDDRWRGLYKTPFDSLGTRSVDAAFALGLIQRDGLALVLSERGREVADEQRRATALRVARSLRTKGAGEAHIDHRFSQSGYRTRLKPDIISFRDAKTALDIGFATRAGDTLTITPAGDAALAAQDA
jgi:hypothetical protein